MLILNILRGVLAAKCKKTKQRSGEVLKAESYYLYCGNSNSKEHLLQKLDYLIVKI